MIGIVSNEGVLVSSPESVRSVDDGSNFNDLQVLSHLGSSLFEVLVTSTPRLADYCKPMSFQKLVKGL